MSKPGRLVVGQRVKVRDATGWPDEPAGRISEPSDEDGGRLGRSIQTTSGPDRFYLVTFDEPQRDGDGDGPYVAGEVLGSYLEPLPPLLAPVTRTPAT